MDFVIIWAASLAALIAFIALMAACSWKELDRMEKEIQAELEALEEEERKAA